MKTEVITLHEDRNVTLTCYLQDIGGEFRNIQKRPAMIVLPGGGYQFCSDREADPVAMPYLKAGYQVFILRYSVAKYCTWPTPLNDYEEAMELIRSKADEFHIYPDKICVIGFSAGGHLAAAAATMAKKENRPNAAILGYAVVGEDVKGCSGTAPSTIPEVDNDTPACFLFHTRTDGVVPVKNSVDFMEALIEKNISFECHIYSHGHHGYSTCDSSVELPSESISSRVPHWVEDSISWLKDVFGDFAPEGMTEPVVKVHVNDDNEAFMSVDCTMQRLMGNPKAAEIVNALLAKMQENFTPEKAQQAEDNAGMDVAAMAAKMKLRDILSFANTPKEVVDSINAQLNQVPNI